MFRGCRRALRGSAGDRRATLRPRCPRRRRISTGLADEAAAEATRHARRPESARSTSSGTPARSRRSDVAERATDVIVVGGGPAGSTLAWRLASDGARVVLLERARFPREKVCGDYVEPRGLAILAGDGLSRDAREARRRCRSPTRRPTSTGVARYRGPDPVLRHATTGPPPHGYIVPRDDLDAVMLEAAEAAGATVHQETAVPAVSASIARASRSRPVADGRTVRYRSALVAGADGVNSIVASAADILSDDERHIAVARRAYATGMDADVGEAMFWFDRSLFPGYGWVFPMSGGRVNVGIGILAETRRRQDIAIPALFDAFLERVRASGPPYDRLELCSTPIGGIVKTYGGAGPRYARSGRARRRRRQLRGPDDRGGDHAGDGIGAPCRPDPVRSARQRRVRRRGPRGLRPRRPGLLRSVDAVPGGMRHDAAQPAPGRSVARRLGARLRARPGRPDVRPRGERLFRRAGRPALERADRDREPGPARPDLAVPGTFSSLRGRSAGTSMGDLLAWQGAWARSLLADPVWHLRWAMEVQRKWVGLLADGLASAGDPRAIGPDAWLASRGRDGGAETRASSA